MCMCVYVWLAGGPLLPVMCLSLYITGSMACLCLSWEMRDLVLYALQTIPTFSLLFSMSRLLCGLIPKVSSSLIWSTSCLNYRALITDFLVQLNFWVSLLLDFSPSHQLLQKCEILPFWKLYVAQWKCRKEASA